eukprot:4135756-Amphidinium_carterae.3
MRNPISGVMERYVKLLEVGREGRPRRASMIRKACPERFNHLKWNGSPECLTITLREYYAQFLYLDREGEYQRNEEEDLDEILSLGVPLIPRLDYNECSAMGRYCVTCGGGFGEIFPCMICENWAHMSCSYGVEGGRVCASHVAVLDSGEGLAVLISDPTKRLEGTILRPMPWFGKTGTAPRKRTRMGNKWESVESEHARLWEMLAMYKSIWLAAGMAYQHGQESTGVKMEDENRGTIERLTLYLNRQHLQPGDPGRRLSRAVILETTPAYLNLAPEGLVDQEKMNKRGQRRSKYGHLVHQYRRVAKTEITQLFALLPAANATDVFAPEVTNAPHFRDLPRDYKRSAFVELSYAAEADRALEYQPLVNQECVPTPTYMQDLVCPENSEGYQRDMGWPLASLTIANVTSEQYEQLWVQTPRGAEEPPQVVEEVGSAFEEDVVFMNEEEERSLYAECAAAREMEVDEGSRGGTLARDPQSSDSVKQPSEQKGLGAPGGTSAGALTQQAVSIVPMEKVIEDWTQVLSQQDEDTDAYKSMKSQIALLKCMVDHYKSALQAAHVYAPAKPPPSST